MQWDAGLYYRNLSKIGKPSPVFGTPQGRPQDRERRLWKRIAEASATKKVTSEQQMLHAGLFGNGWYGGAAR